MNISGPIQSSLPPIQEKFDQFLKVNQRIAGEVISISNEQVVLAVNGVQIVAKMTTSEQLALLMERRYANFIVKDISNNQITLQIANPAQTTSGAKLVMNNTIGLALLEQLGLPVDQSNMTIVQAALTRGLKITPELVNNMRLVLETSPGWGQGDAQLAAAIKSSGLPLTEGSLSLAQSSIKDIKSNLLTLLSQMNETLQRPGLNPQTQQMIRSLQSALQGIMVQAGDSKSDLERNLMSTIKGLGSSLEFEISKLLSSGDKDSQSSKMSGILFNLANLRHEIGNSNLGRLTSSIDNFIEGLRWMHFINSEPEQLQAKGQWTQLDIPISFGNNPINRLQDDNIHNLKIRIAHENDEESGSKINPDYTRLVIQVDLDEYDTIKVDLSIVSHLIGAEITASNDEICLKASEELNEFKMGLSNLGYTLKTSKIELGNSILEMDMNESGRALPTISSVDLGA